MRAVDRIDSSSNLFVRLALRPGEGAALVWSSLYFYLLLSAYYILRPIRDNIGAIVDPRKLSWLFTATLFAMLLLHPIFAALVARLPRQRFIAWTYRFFIVCLALFFLIFRNEGHTPSLLTGGTFFVWVSVFNLFVVSVFWSHLTDLYRPRQSKRLFGVIALGGTLGAVSGAGITSVLSSVFSAAQLLLVSAVILELAVHVSSMLERERQNLIAAAESDGDHAPPCDSAAERIGGRFWDGIVAVLRSPYLLNISFLMLLYTITTTFIYFEQAEITRAVFATDSAGRTRYFANVDLLVNTITAVVQLFATGKLLRYLGVGMALILVPLLSMVGFAALAFWPTLSVLAAFWILRRAGNYALTQPARQVLYTVLSRSDKYKAKNFNDTFIYRFGDQAGAWSYAGLSALGLSAAALSLLMVPISLGHTVVSWWLGQHYRRLESDG